MKEGRYILLLIAGATALMLVPTIVRALDAMRQKKLGELRTDLRKDAIAGL